MASTVVEEPATVVTATTTIRRREVDVAPEAEENRTVEHVSYSKQYDLIFSKLPLKTETPINKPELEAQAKEPGAKPILGSDIYFVPKRNIWSPFNWDFIDWGFAWVLGSLHALCLFAPMTFSWNMFALFWAGYIVTGLFGITLSFHRQLSHRSFQTPKWLEYILAYCGVLAVQGDPIEWVSQHRYHHLHTDTPLDPHSPFEGFWFSHIGWLLDHKNRDARCYDQSNAREMSRQFFYKYGHHPRSSQQGIMIAAMFIQKTYYIHVVLPFAALYYYGGFPALVWGGALRVVWVWHHTWNVNSVAHVWGSQTYKTGDLSKNNWLVALFTFGEGWHNNHHAFKFSAMHGLEWWQFDMTYLTIKTLEALGLAWKVQLPSKTQKERLAM